MNTTPTDDGLTQNFSDLLTDEQRAKLAEIQAASRARFGHGLFRMEATDDGADQDGNDGSDEPGDGGDQDSNEQPGNGDPFADPVKARAEIEKLRKENAAHRTKAKTAGEEAQAALVQQLGKALGLIKDDEKPTADDLTAKLAERDAAVKTQALENLVLRHAGGLNANADRLLDSRNFGRALDGIDPTDADAATAVKAAITKALEADASLKNTPVVAKGGNEMPGSGDSAKKPGDLTSALAAHYGK